MMEERSRKCFSCSEEGHRARKCPKPRTTAAPGKTVDPTQKLNRHDRPQQQNPQSTNKASITTRLQEWCGTVSVPRKGSSSKSQAYGKPSLCEVISLGIRAKALIDTGSVISIISLGTLRRAQKEGADLDSMVTMLGEVNVQDIKDASGNPMKFLQLISTNLEVQGAGKARVLMHVQDSMNETILLGTNALESLGIYITFKKPDTHLSVKSWRHSTTEEARVVARVLVPPGGTSNVNITGPILHGERVLSSSTERIGSGVCHIENGTTVVPVTNQSKQPWTLRKGDRVGCWTNVNMV
ncbi:zinc knuckle [Cooperia oncophora]